MTFIEFLSSWAIPLLYDLLRDLRFAGYFAFSTQVYTALPAFGVFLSFTGASLAVSAAASDHSGPDLYLSGLYVASSVGCDPAGIPPPEQSPLHAVNSVHSALRSGVLLHPSPVQVQRMVGLLRGHDSPGLHAVHLHERSQRSHLRGASHRHNDRERGSSWLDGK